MIHRVLVVGFVAVGSIMGGVLAVLPGAGAGMAADIKIGLLKFGTVNWEMDVISHHGLDTAEGISIDVLPMANGGAGKIALQSGDVDMIVSDWLWVARQRQAGADLTFVPYSKAVGGVVVAKGSPIRTLADLRGKRLGIAGGPLDKSWLLLRARVMKEANFDLDRNVEKVFGAPPLLNHQILTGKIDAVITFWHYVARLEAQGLRSLTRLSETLEALDVSSGVPLIGFTFSEKWANANRNKVEAFVRASRKAKEILQNSDAEWTRIKAKTKAGDDATLEALRDGYRAGIPDGWGVTERKSAEKMYAILAEYGGGRLIESGTTLDPGTFWAPITY